MEVNKTISPPAAAPMGGSSGKKPATLNISNLMSPPDPVPFDNFNQHHTIHVASTPSRMPSQPPKEGGNEERPSMPMSPPVSPPAQTSSDAIEPASPAIKDPILYPRDEAPPSPPQQPLFPAEESVQHRRLVNEHIAHRNLAMFRKSAPPKPEDYELALQVKSQVLNMFTKDRKSWMQKQREQLVHDRTLNHDRWNNNKQRYPPIAPAKSAKIPIKVPAPRRTPANKPDRVVKPTQVRLTQGPRAPRPNANPSRGGKSTTPEPGRRVVAPNREDRDFNALEDLCPPLSSLPNKPNSLKVDWKGAPVDLTNDPHANLLHPDELSLAANLRLDCATYLTSKRRIFMRRRDCAKTGKEFRKTDAQQACKIDVNKASKLWTAFEKVGWLDIRWMAGRY